MKIVLVKNFVCARPLDDGYGSLVTYYEIEMESNRVVVNRISALM